MTSRIRSRLSKAFGFATLALASAAIWLAVTQQAVAQHSVTLPDHPSGPSAARHGGSLTRPLPDDSETAPDLPSIIPSGDPTEDPRDVDPDDEQQAADGQRTAVRDGDLSHPAEPYAARDGIVASREPEPVRDGVDPLTIDTRPAADIAAFESPAAGYDPLLFQIEDIEPIADRRTRRLFNQEPYDPVGMRIGSFVLFPEAELGGSWYSNVLRSSVSQSDYAFDYRPSARLVSDWRRHALEFRAGSTLSFLNEFDSENDKAYQFEARGRLDLTRRTNMQAFISRDVSQESRSAIDANAVGDRADVTLDRAGATLNHRFNRLSLQLRGSVSDYKYSDVDVGGVTQSNDDRNYTATEEAVRASWEFKPTLTGFAEVAVNQRRYDVAAQSDGILRDSDGQRYRVGVSFGNTSNILRGEFALGYGIQTPVDERLGAIEGVIVDANVGWRVSELTTLLFSARSDVSETTTTGSGGVFTRQAGVEARHAFRHHLIGMAGITYTYQDYQGVDITENEWRADLGLEYYLSRGATLFSRYRHTIFDSNTVDADYTSDEIHLGLRIRR